MAVKPPARQPPAAVHPKPAQPSPSKPQAKREDFDLELIGRKVSVKLADGEWVTGVLWERSRFWLKLVVGGRYVYINKSHVIRVEVVKE